MLLSQPEHRRERSTHHHRPLGRLVHHEPIPFPAGDGGKEPHRAVGFRRNAERLVVDDFCGGDGSRDVTALEFDPHGLRTITAPGFSMPNTGSVTL